MYKSAWLFFISLFGFCLVTIVFINYTAWTGLYLSNYGDLTHTYFGFTSMLSMISDLNNFYNNHADFMQMNTLTKALNYYWDYAGGFFSMLGTIGQIVNNGYASSTDIIKIVSNLLSMLFISVTGPVFVAFILLVIGYWILAYAFIMVTVVINALQGAYNVSMPSTDYMPSSILESLSVWLQTPLVSPYGVQGVTLNTIHVIKNTIFSC